MLSQVYVKNSVHEGARNAEGRVRRGKGRVCGKVGDVTRGVCKVGDMHDRWHAWQGACVVGACISGVHAWQRGACMAVGMHGGGGGAMAGEMVTAVNDKNPTGIHSCWAFSLQ